MPKPLLVLALFATLAAGNDGAEVWQSVPDEGTLRFIIQFDGSETEGLFRQFDVRMTVGAAGMDIESLTVGVDATSADMFSRELNEGLAEPAWFHFERYPRARYSSHAVERRGQGRYAAAGTLELKGVQRSVTVPFEWRREGDRGRLAGTVVLRRSEFDIGSGEWAQDDTIGQEVRVEFDVVMAPKE